jgi:hypothetical protein
MWDDGEFVNGIDRTLGPARFAAAKQAWFDYQPVMRRRGDPDRTPSAATVTFRVIGTFDRQARATTRAAWVVPADPHRRRPRPGARPADRPRGAARPGAERTV